MTHPVPPAGRRRVLMLTPDVMIDRRILHEGEALSDVGYEVILLAWSGLALPGHERIGRVKVHRLSYPTLPPPPPTTPGSLRWAWRLARRCVRGGVIRPYRAVRRRLDNGLRRLTGKRFAFNQRNEMEALYHEKGLFYRPDIIHVHDLPMLPVGAQLKAALRVPLVYDMHESYPDQSGLTEAQQRMLLADEHQYIGAADVCITVNELLHGFIQDRYNLPCFGVVQNAVPHANFDAGARYDRFRADYPELRDKLLVLYQGWLAPGRNLETAIRAMARVNRPDLVLIFMGYGEYARDLAALAEAEGVDRRVLFVPAKKQDELLSYSASADVGLIPYPTNRDVNTRLASPNKLYEFTAARLPMLANRLPFVQGVVEKWGFGTVADLDDVDAFAAALNRVDREKLPAYRERLAREGWRLSWEQERAHLLALYEKLPIPVSQPSRVA